VIQAGTEECAVLDADDEVVAWVKNHKLFLEIPYCIWVDYVTDRLRGDPQERADVLLEGKVIRRKDDARPQRPRWVEAVNAWGGLGTWVHAICYDAGNLVDQLEDSSPRWCLRPVTQAPISPSPALQSAWASYLTTGSTSTLS